MPLDFIAKPLEQILVAITDATHNYGISIIIFTFLVRLVISPLNLTQLRSAKAMAALSPRLKELQKKHGKDRETLTKATMDLYKEHKVNPMAGCLPLIIQLPVLWGLFNALRSMSQPCYPNAVCSAAQKALGAHNIYHSAFLWLPNLGNPDPYHILPIVAGIMQWVQSRMMMQPTTDPQQQQMNQIMQFMPLMIVVFAWQYQAGLAVYWVCSTIFSIALQYFVNRDSLNGPWGQLPILGNGSLPAFLVGGNRAANAQPAAVRTSTSNTPATTSQSSTRPTGTTARGRSATVVNRIATQPRVSREQDGNGATTEGQPPGPRPRGPRPTGTRRPGLPAKGVKK